MKWINWIGTDSICGGPSSLAGESLRPLSSVKCPELRFNLAVGSSVVVVKLPGCAVVETFPAIPSGFFSGSALDAATKTANQTQHHTVPFIIIENSYS